MAQSTVLQLVRDACGEMGLSVPSSVVGNTQQDIVQILALVNALGAQLQREYEWQALCIEYQFNSAAYSYTGNVGNGSSTISSLSSTAGLTANPTYFQVTGTGIAQNTYLTAVNAGLATATIGIPANATAAGGTYTFSQTKYPMPADYDRLTDRTDWDKSQHWEMLGPETAQQWQWLKSGWISTGPRVRFRMLDQYFQIWPPLGVSHLLGFEYISQNWVSAAGGAQPSKSRFSADTDTCIFPDRLMVQGLKLRYFEIKGFETTALYRDYMAQLDIAKANDHGSPTLSFAPRPTSILIGYENIPDANYGS